MAAFHLGLSECLGELTELMNQDRVLYHHGYRAAELRKLMNLRKLPDFVNEDELYFLAEKVVAISEKGLKQRGFGEERYLKSLYTRIEERTNPAKKMLEKLESGNDIEDVIAEYAVPERF